MDAVAQRLLLLPNTPPSRRGARPRGASVENPDSTAPLAPDAPPGDRRDPTRSDFPRSDFTVKNDRTSASNDYWVSLGELEQTQEFQDALHREFPEGASSLEGVDRRRFLQLMGASTALAGAQSCRWEKTKLLPLAERPEGRVPGVSEHFASAFELDGVALPVLVTSYEGRPTKIEGNDLHPCSQGASTTFSQAATLELYDPERAKFPTQQGARRSSDQLAAGLSGLRESLLANGGQGFAILDGPSSSPALAGAREALERALPNARWFRYAPAASDRARRATELAFGRAHRVHLRLDQARILLDLDSDLFGLAPDALSNSRGFAVGRDADSDRPLNRSYSVEARHTASGASADHRLPLRHAQIGAFLAALEAKLVAEGGLTPSNAWGGASSAPSAAFLNEAHVADFLTALTEDLLAHRGASAIVVGADQPAEVQALGLRVNAMLGNLGNAVVLTEEPVAPASSAQLAELAQGIEGGAITKLLVIGGNPVYDAPGDIDFGALMERLEASVVHSLYMDETARKATWHVPAAHWLESWGDARAYDGSYLVVQPLLRPLYGGKSALELVDYLAGGAWRDGQQIVRESFSRQPGVTDGRAWKRTLHDGFLAGSELPALSPSGRAIPALELGSAALAGTAAPQNGNLELVVHADAKVYDGRFANSGWLQELPDFMTKMCWDNAALIAPSTASQLNVTTGDLVELTLDGRTLEAVAYVMPGQAQGSVSLSLGYGRTSAGQVGGSVHDPVEIPGFDASKLTAGTATGAWQGLQVAKTGKTYPIAMTQEHHQVDAAGMKERDQDQGPVKSRVAELIHETDAENWRHIQDEYASGSLLGLYRGGDPLHHGEEGHGPHEHGDHDHGSHDHEGDAHGGPGGGGHGPHLNELQSFVGPELRSIWDENPYGGDYAWAMSIDLNSCTGCNACVIACQAENNIPVVGKEQVMRGREMHWLRIDRYFRGDQDRPEVRSQPVGCIQCENAPCEQVCPVAATVHSEEGLNDMAYNRCIGTRYCSNNCPVKVRRFNFFNYHRELKTEENDVKRLSFNPEVSVRARGVMEKCTYCVQRIQNAKIQAKVEQRRVRDGEIETACQQVCPSESIVFGDLKTEGAKVRERQSSQRAYHMLAFLNIKPRTAYLSRITNPHPLLASHDSSHESGHGEIHSETHAETPVGADH